MLQGQVAFGCHKALSPVFDICGLCSVNLVKDARSRWKASTCILNHSFLIQMFKFQLKIEDRRRIVSMCLWLPSISVPIYTMFK